MTGNRLNEPRPKATNLTLVKLGMDAIEYAYGSQENYWKHIAEESKISMPHLKLLTEHVYGKPREMQEIQIQNVPIIDMSMWK